MKSKAHEARSVDSRGHSVDPGVLPVGPDPWVLEAEVADAVLEEEHAEATFAQLY
jgi:hypothetical protein